jgi:magnesium-transporting ATPase (P-type)
MKKNRPAYTHPWHTLSPEATCEILTSTDQGLSGQEAEYRLTQYGFNKLTAAASRGPLKRFFQSISQCSYLCIAYRRRCNGSY